MKGSTYLILFFLCLCGFSYGQQQEVMISGTISYVTANNVYVRFESTDKIEVGATLKFLNQPFACLRVEKKSSRSVVCSRLNDCPVNKGDEVFFHTSNGIAIPETTNDESLADAAIYNDSLKTGLDSEGPTPSQSRIKGRFSIGTYSNFSNIRADRHSLLSTFSMQAEHIKDSRFSFYAYMNYRQNFVAKEIQYNKKTTFFNVYDLALKYRFNNDLSVVAGRKINPRMSSVGAIDGLQIEKGFHKNYIGLIGGFRPDIHDYSFNSDLVQYGAYIGRNTSSNNFRSETTMGFIEQKNKSETDRRYAYLQHASTLFSDLSLFASAELDLFSKVSDTVKNDIRLTNLYVSARYRFSRQVNLMVSYDSRKRIIYYETFQSEIERMLDDDLARQGLRLRINLRPIKYLYAGISYGKRFQSDDQNKSDNIHAYARYSRIPVIQGNISLTYNRNSSNYLLSNIFSLRYYSTAFSDKINYELFYRKAYFDYFNSFTGKNVIDYYGASLGYNINRKLAFSIYSELSSGKEEKNYRIFAKLFYRF